MTARLRRPNVSSRTSALDAVVYGVDIQSGDVRGTAPSYALAVYDGDGFERDVVSYRKLRRLIDDEEPAIVATDNAYELAEDKDDLVRFLGALPDPTRLVQVTGADRPEPLSRVADRHDVPYAKDPMSEAEAAARLAAQNVGQVVTAFTDRTRLKVSRGRSTGSGGWSEDRYTRRIHGAVRKRSREVQSALEDAGLEYDREVTEKYGGFSRAVFEVEARPDDIPVSRERSGDVRVEIDRVRRDGIEFRPLAKRRDHVLVGVDPGTTTAVAILDLDGEVLDVLSTRTADTADIVEWIVERGRPLVVAADVTPMPETVEQVRRSFDAAGWTPPSDLPIDEKQHRTREHAYDNDHERDAMAAALEAYDDHADQFRRVDRKVPPGVDTGAVLADVLDGESVETALAARADDDGDDDAATEPDNEPSPEQRRIRDLERQVDRLQDHVEDLEATADRKDARIEELEAELDEARREERREARERREVSRLERQVSRLEGELEAERDRADDLAAKVERMKALWKLDHSNFSDVEAEKDGLVPVKPVEEFTVAAIEAADESYGLSEDDVVYLRDAGGAGRSTAERLVDIAPRVVLKNGGLSDVADEILFEHEVPVGPAAEVAMQEVDELAVAREDDVEAVIEDWHERAEVRRKQRTAETIDRIISEHRADRDRAGAGDGD
jgi:predicted RNase H-like nuclease (RuvC/YqgF family)